MNHIVPTIETSSGDEVVPASPFLLEQPQRRSDSDIYNDEEDWERRTARGETMFSFCPEPVQSMSTCNLFIDSKAPTPSQHQVQVNFEDGELLAEATNSRNEKNAKDTSIEVSSEHERQTADFSPPRQIMVSEATTKFPGERVPTNTLRSEGQSIKLARFFQEVMDTT